MSAHETEHVLGRKFDADCSECQLRLSRLLRNAERWAGQARELAVN